MGFVVNLVLGQKVPLGIASQNMKLVKEARQRNLVSNVSLLQREVGRLLAQLYGSQAVTFERHVGRHGVPVDVVVDLGERGLVAVEVHGP